MIENGMSLVYRSGVPTHSRGNTLDLIKSNYGELADINMELG